MNLVFKEKKYVIIRKAISEELCNFGMKYLDLMGDRGNLDTDAQMWDTQNSILKKDHSKAGYATFFGETILSILKSDIEMYTGFKLTPTYSYSRIYDRGAILGRHTDRPACEISASINLGYTDGKPWPLLLEDINGVKQVVDLDKGDMILYRGIELPHWRETNTYCDKLYQLFIHYVETDGRYMREKFDGRKMLGVKYSEDKYNR